MDDKKIKELLKNKNFKTKMLILFILGITFLYIGSSPYLKKEKKTEVVQNEEIKDEIKNDDLENRLKNILSKVEGAGNVDVMITYKNDKELVVAQNTEEEQEEDTNKIRQNLKSDYVIIESEDGSYEPLVLKEISPSIEGVLIVAEGGDNIIVKNGLLKAAESLLNVPSHKIEILKMK